MWPKRVLPWALCCYGETSQSPWDGTWDVEWEKWPRKAERQFCLLSVERKCRLGSIDVLFPSSSLSLQMLCIQIFFIIIFIFVCFRNSNPKEKDPRRSVPSALDPSRSLPWFLCLFPVYSRTESSFQKMMEGSVFPDIMTSEGKNIRNAEHFLSVSVSFAGLAGDEAVTGFVETWVTHWLGRAFKMNYLISGKAFSGQPELFVVKLVSDIWAKKKKAARRIKWKNINLVSWQQKKSKQAKTLGIFCVFCGE